VDALIRYGFHAREGAKCAFAITCQEMETIDKPSHWAIRGSAEIVEHVGP
jgi:hypothetical protein